MRLINLSQYRDWWRLTLTPYRSRSIEIDPLSTYYESLLPKMTCISAKIKWYLFQVSTFWWGDRKERAGQKAGEVWSHDMILFYNWTDKEMHAARGSRRKKGNIGCHQLWSILISWSIDLNIEINSIDQYRFWANSILSFNSVDLFLDIELFDQGHSISRKH